MHNVLLLDTFSFGLIRTEIVKYLKKVKSHNRVFDLFITIQMEVWNVKGKLLKGVLSFGIGLGVLYGGSSVQADTSTDQNNTLKVMTHNVYMLSTNLYPNWGQSQRADLIGAADYIKNQDVVILNEVFDNSASDRLLGNLKKEYPNNSSIRS